MSLLEPTPQERTEAFLECMCDLWEIIARHEAAKAAQASQPA